MTTTETTTDTPVRCSDADRERTSATLHEAAGTGCLTMDEAEERLAKVYAARHVHELAELTADLPAAQAPARAGWAAILLLAWHQLVADARALVGRGGAAVTGRRRLVLALAALLLVVGVIAMAMHGIVEGPGDHHGFAGHAG
ncbi:hypothetical protein GCM10009836_38540 [Pseudonocardia ailaonensis]|uniref:DUF1707 domain-containing protein n=1 Tax=Pseudonocardia ailaonensis TaxID=367279 RepID=A0ABN2N665_9PSEU